MIPPPESAAHLMRMAPLPVFAPHLVWIPLLPLAAFAILILVGRRLGRLSGWLAVAALAGSCALVLAIAAPVFNNRQLVVQWPWLSATDPVWSLGLAVDGLSWVMLAVVTTIAPLIALYSIGYMHDDARFSRYFAYFSLFCASMIGLVMADHFALLYVCWELVGLCSYLLISFWFEKPAAAAAGRKAFLTTRIGDTGLLVAILLLAWQGAGTLHFHDLELVRHQLPTGLLTLISALIFLGAVGKSAQIPLHVWLPDAMEGPTPVSALIHAATMVAAGVYLVARTAALFTPESRALVLVIGLSTHLLAGTVALTQMDIKRILAYSTISQLGLMMTALGVGAVAPAIFHLMTHAFFKALLFLGAGSVIHATHQQDLAHLGALRRQMPWTSTVFLVASLSMSGMFLLSGFWSKDAILLAAGAARPWLLWALLGGALLTTGYIFRLYLRCFHGTSSAHSTPRPADHDRRAVQRTPCGGQAAHSIHESPAVMVLPMVLLAIGAAVAGWAGSPWYHPFFDLLGAHEVHAFSPFLAALSTAILLAGVWLAWMVGVRRRTLLPTGLRPLGQRLYTVAFNKYYVDELYGRVIIQPFLAMTEWSARFDQRVIDGAVNGAGAAGDLVSRWKERFDRVVVDGLVNGVAATVRGIGAVLRLMQTGVIQQYLLVVVAAVVVLSFVLRY